MSVRLLAFVRVPYSLFFKRSVIDVYIGAIGVNGKLVDIDTRVFDDYYFSLTVNSASLRCIRFVTYSDYIMVKDRLNATSTWMSVGI